MKSITHNRFLIAILLALGIFQSSFSQQAGSGQLGGTQIASPQIASPVNQTPLNPGKAPKCGGGVMIEVTEQCPSCTAIKETYPDCPKRGEENRAKPPITEDLGNNCIVNVCKAVLKPGERSRCLDPVRQQYIVPCCVPNDGSLPVIGPDCLKKLTCCGDPCRCGCSKWQIKGYTGNGFSCGKEGSFDTTQVNPTGLPACSCDSACKFDSKICSGEKPAPKRCERLKCDLQSSGATSCTVELDCGQDGCCQDPRCSGHPSCPERVCVASCSIDPITGEEVCQYDCNNGCCCKEGNDKCSEQCPRNPVCAKAAIDG
jgi:hypothetical protein